MLSTLQRLLPFLGRSGNKRDSQSKPVSLASARQEGQALSLDQLNAIRTDTSGSCWSTLSHNEVQEFKRGARFNLALGSRRAARAKDSHFLGASLFRLKDEFVVNEDVSNGRERNKIPALSYRRTDSAPDDYHYVTEHIHIEPTNLDDSLAKMVSCNCVGDCSSGKCKCSSFQASGRCYNSRGRLNSSYNMDAPEVIRECNIGCKCNRKACNNMVIQKGSRAKLVLFKTKSRGWGVRTLEPLARGTFIGVYSGELISATSSYSRTDDTYLFNLANTHIYQQQEQQPASEGSCQEEQQLSDAQQEQVSEQQQTRPEDQFVCDAKHYGNITRFINHSCEPNVIGVRSYTVHNDSRFPYIAFFTRREIPANAELTLNYGDNYWLVKCKRDGVYCLCKHPKCRFSNRTFARTLKQHNRQRQQQASNQNQ